MNKTQQWYNMKFKRNSNKSSTHVGAELAGECQDFLLGTFQFSP